MLKFTSIVGYTSCGPTYIERFLTIFGQCINVLNYNTPCTQVMLFSLSRFSAGFSSTREAIHTRAHSLVDPYVMQRDPHSKVYNPTRWVECTRHFSVSFG